MTTINFQSDINKQIKSLEEKINELSHNKTPQGRKAYMKLKLTKKLAMKRLKEPSSIIQNHRDSNGNIVTKKSKRSLIAQPTESVI